MTKIPDRNIISLLKIRNYEIDISLANALYPQTREIKTMRGRWEVCSRIDYSKPSFFEEDVKKEDGVCAIYYNKKGDPTTLFSADFEQGGLEKNIELVNFTARQLADKTLEQNIFLRFREDTAENYSIIIGAVVGGTLMILPLYLKHANPNIIKDGNETLGLFLAGIVLGGYVILSSGVGTIKEIAKSLGDNVDKRRMRGLPTNFLYGTEAIKYLNNQTTSNKYQTALISSYQHFQENGVDIPKPDFQKVFDGIRKPYNRYEKQGIYIDDIARAILAKQNIPLEKALNILNVN